MQISKTNTLTDVTLNDVIRKFENHPAIIKIKGSIKISIFPYFL